MFVVDIRHLEESCNEIQKIRKELHNKQFEIEDVCRGLNQNSEYDDLINFLLLHKRQLEEQEELLRSMYQVLHRAIESYIETENKLASNISEESVSWIKEEYGLNDFSYLENLFEGINN